MVRSIFALLAACAVASVSAVSMQYGQLDWTRDLVVSYDHSVYADSEAFCKSLHKYCVDYVGAIGDHHQLDCVFSIDGEAAQSTTNIHAFCGGIEKNADGTWTTGSTITDYTKAVLSQYYSGVAAPKYNPISCSECLKYQLKNPETVTCSACNA